MKNAITRLKIGFVLDDGLDKPDGVQQNILTLGKWLKNKGHDVVYIVGETRRTDIPSVIPLSKNLKVSFNGNRLSIPLFSSARKIQSVLTIEKFDVLHVQVPYSPIMAGRLIKRLDKKTALVGTFHILPSGFASFWGNVLLGKALSKNLKKFDKQLAVSEPAKQFARQSFKINCDILANPVNINKYRPKPRVPNNNAPVRIFFLGRLVSRKGCGKFLEAVKHMLDKNLAKNEFYIDICGGGPHKNKLKRYANGNNLNSRVKFHGFIPESEKIKFMQQADILVFPSISGESFGIVLLEAMAAGGGVVIGGDNPGYRSVLGSLEESLVDPLDINKFSERISIFINSADARRKLHRKQQELVQQFDVNSVGAKLLDIYNDCITAKKGR
ncbi:glycosyltransferase family 4 protein [Candidatus Parcubacteria bacterium]|nr:glycosyltransferase family 4 protein [Candidatus Parcubacteria bacterium]